MSLFDAFSGHSGRLAGMAQINAINQGMNTANTALDTAQSKAETLYGQAAGNYQPSIDLFSRGANVYGDATGANGAEGQTRAQQLFQSDPGYQFQQQQGQDAVLRSASARGMLAGGNTSIDLLKQSQGLADQSYGNWVSRLAPYNAADLMATTGQSNAYNLNAALYPQIAGMKANVATQGAQGIGQAAASAQMAGQKASTNSLNALMGGLSLGASLLGSGMGGGGSTGGLGSQLMQMLGGNPYSGMVNGSYD